MSRVELLMGSKRNIPMEISRLSGQDFEIEKLEYQVFNRFKDIIDQGTHSDQHGMINGHIIHYFMDTTRPIFEENQTYTICYAASIANTPKVIKGERKVRIKECV